MKPAKVERYKLPKYPARLEVMADPKLLQKHMPESWKRPRELAGAAAILLAASTASCNPKKPTTAKLDKAIVAPIFEHGEGRAIDGCIVVTRPYYISEDEAKQMIREELARYGIQLSDEGAPIPVMSLQTCFLRYYIGDKEVSSGEFDNFYNKKRREYNSGKLSIEIPEGGDFYEAIGVRQENKKEPFTLKLIDRDRQVAVEYISDEETFRVQDYSFDKKCNGDDGQNYSVGSIETKNLAMEVAKHMNDSPDRFYVGVFYDPLVETINTFSPYDRYNECVNQFYIDKGLEDEAFVTRDCVKNDGEDICSTEIVGTYEYPLDKVKTLCREKVAKDDQERIKQDKKEAERLLRLQVKDFVEWLKAQGAI